MIDEAVRPARWWVGLILAALAIAPYAQTWNHQFINYDDNLYVTENPVVKGGLTWNGVAWAFSTYDGGNWHPLTWLSHSLDYSLFGNNPGPPHLENAILHALNTLL